MNKDSDKTKAQLLAELAELRKKSKEQEDNLKVLNQQLDANNQQLRAANQQLEANNQQLSATEQQLRANNQQLIASEKALKESESKLNTAQQLAKIGDFSWNVISGEVTWSDGMYKLLKYDKDENIDLAEVNMKIHHPDDLDRITKWLNDFLALGKDKLEPNEYRIIRKDGKVIWVHTEGNITYENGKAVSVFGMCQDITERKQAQEELQRSETLFRAITEQSGEGISLADNSGNYVKVNPAFSKITGFSEEELLTMNVRDLVPPETEIKLFPQVRDGKSGKREIELLRKDGSHFMAEINGYPIQLAGQNLVLGITRDITERKQAEKTLKESEERFRLLTENTLDTIWSTDQNFNTIFVNNAVTKFLGYSPEEFLALKSKKFISKEDMKILQEAAEKLISEYKQGNIIQQKLELKYIRKDGKIIDVEVTANLLFNDKKEFIGFQGRSIDITERKLAEEELKASENRLKQAEEIAHLGHWELNLTNNILIWSDEVYRIFDLKPQEFEATYEAFLDNIHPDDREKVNEAYTNSLETKTNYEIEHRLLLKNGELKYVLEKCRTEYDDTGKPIRSIGSVLDITERKQAEEALKTSLQQIEVINANTPNIIWKSDIDKQGHFINTYISEVVDEFLALPKGTINNSWDKYFSYIVPDYLPQINELFKKAITNPGELFSFSYEVKKADGKTAWFMSRGRIRVENNKLTSYGSTVDITERKQAEDALESSEESLKTAQRVAHVGNYKYNLKTGEVFWSDELLKIYGLDPAETGNILSVEDSFKNVHPEDAEQLQLLVDKAVEQGIGISLDYRIIRPNGEHRYLFGFNEPEFDKDGHLSHILGTAQDITERKQAEKALKESEEKYRELSTLLRLMADNMPDMLWAKNLSNEYIFVNKAICTDLLNAKDTDEPLGKTDMFFAQRERNAYPDNPKWHTFGEICRDSDAATLEAMKPTHFDEFGNVREKFLFLDVHKAPLYDGDGQLIGVVGSARDVTAAKEAENQLLKLSTAVTQSPSLIAITDTDGKLEYVNPKFAEITGYNWEEVIGQNPRILKSGEHPAERYKEIWETILAGKTWRGELHNKKKNGELFWTLSSISPIVNEKGEITNYIDVAEDITERKQAEEALKESEEKYRKIFENVQDIFYQVDNEGNIIEISPSIKRYSGYSREELIGTPVTHTYYNPNDRALLNAELEKKGEVVDYEIRLKTKSERLIYVSLNAHILYDENKKPAGIEGSLRDITERKQAESEVLQRVTELEMLYQSGLALNQSLSPEEIAHQIITLLEEKMDWHHIVIRLYRPQDQMFEILAFSLPDMEGKMGKNQIRERLKTRVPTVGVGLCGWAIQNNQILRVGDLKNHPHYVDTFPNLHSGLYVPMKLGQRTIGVISIESERPDAFSERDERLVVTLTNQAAQAIENSRQLRDAQRRATQLAALHKIDQAITSSFDLQFTLDTLLKHLLEQLEVDAAAVLRHQKDTQTLSFVQGKGFRSAALQHTNLRLGEGLSGKVALESRAIFIPDLRQAETSFSKSPGFEKEGFVVYYGIPLMAKDILVGVLEIFHRSPLNPDNEWINFLQVLSAQAAIAIDNAAVYVDLQNSNQNLLLAYDATIEGWAQALELRDMETEGHSRRVVKLVTELAQQMGVAAEKMSDIYRGALLHDIGKMGIPDAILQKPGELTDEEWKIMQLHPVYAYEWLSRIDYLASAIDIPHYHHERWDGTGYPYGLKGEEIPLAARIFAIVDVWDALRSDRPYRKAWSREKTLQHIREASGKHFDPKVVDAFLKLV